MIFDTVRDILCDHFALNSNEIESDSSLMDDFGADSLDLLDITVALEDAFDIDIPDDEAEELKTVDDIVKYIQNRTE